MRTRKEMLLRTMEHLPLESSRKQALIETLRDLTIPEENHLSLLLFIELLVINNACQPKNAVHAPTDDFGWKLLEKLYNEAKKAFLKQDQAELTWRAAEKDLIPFIAALYEYNLQFSSLDHSSKPGQIR
jgi:hypothetical protein